MHNFTPEELISYLYKETSAETTAAIEEAIAQSWVIREKLEVIKQSMERLDTLVVAPRTEAVLAVLSYAHRQEKLTSTAR